MGDREDLQVGLGGYGHSDERIDKNGADLGDEAQADRAQKAQKALVDEDQEAKKELLTSGIKLPDELAHFGVKKTHAIVLLNMGGPNSLEEVEPFLRNMFNDEHILQMNALARKMVAHIIVSKRLPVSKQNYTAIGGSSPITSKTFDLVKTLGALDRGSLYTYAMRYAPPFTQMVLEDLKHQGIESIDFFPMYPQYSTTTTKSSVDEVAKALDALDYAPEVNIIEPYYDDSAFISLICDKIEATCKQSLDLISGNINAPLKGEDTILVLSAHSLPVKIIKGGDPYKEQCEASAKAVHKELTQRGHAFRAIYLAYQSHMEGERWIGPSIDATLRRVASEYEGSAVLIYPLSFTIDNSETLYELKIFYKDLAARLGINKYLVSSCLNSDASFADFIVQRCRQKRAEDKNMKAKIARTLARAI